MDNVQLSRVICFFSSSVSPRSFRYIYKGQTGAERSSVLEACFDFHLLPEDDRQRVFIPIQTPETMQFLEEMKLRLQAQGWMRAGDMWEAFSIENSGQSTIEAIISHMLGVIRPSDEIFIEPTNGLRSISLALIFGSIYMQVLHPDINIGRLIYGEFAQRSGADNTASSSELHDISRLQEIGGWAQDAHTFGSLLIGQPMLARLAHPTHDKRTQNALASLEQLGAALSVAQVPYLIKSLRELKIPNINQEDIAAREALTFFERNLKPLQMAAAQTKAKQLNHAWLSAELQLAERLFDAGRLGDMARVLREWVVNVVLLALEAPPHAKPWYQTKGRAEAEAWLGKRSGGRHLNTPEPWLSLAKLGSNAHNFRNQLSHGGYQNQGEDEKPISKEVLEKLLKDAQQWWSEHRNHVVKGALSSPPQQGIFLNLTNHPQAGWSPAQREAALQLGTEIVDLPFPEVPADHDQLEEIRQQITAHIGPNVATALVQGEPILSVLLVAHLQKQGIRCFSATSRRDVEMIEGAKKIVFHFDHLRPWPALSIN